MVGRDQEVAAVRRLLGGRGLRAVVIEGEPGIGKTTVWQELLEPGALVARAVEAETQLGYAALADLLAPVVDEHLDALPEPQRVAIEVALLRRTATGRVDRRAVATGVHSLLRRCAPVLLAIDDVQWLDRSSAAVLSFALRRLADQDVRVLLTKRAGVDDPIELDAQRMTLGPLTLSGIHHVIRQEIGHVFPRPTLQRVVQASGGNPLFAVELARALAETGARPGPGEPLPVPDTLTALMQTRIARLSDGARDALLVCASLSSPTTEVVDDVSEAERAGFVTVDGTRIRFTHPLLASTVYASASATERRAVHARLAEVVTDSEEQVRHLALAVQGEDEAVAAALEIAAHNANARAAPQVAAELAALACRATPSTDARRPRTLALCEYLFRSGDTEEAARRANELLQELPPGATRARTHELLARIGHVATSAAGPAEHCAQALADAGDDVQLRALIHATGARVGYDDFTVAREHAEAVHALLDQIDDPMLESQALCAYIGCVFSMGEPLPKDLVDRALALEEHAAVPDVADRVSAAVGVWLKLDGDFDGARRWLEKTYRDAVDEGDDASLPYALSHLPQLDLWMGRWDDSERHALEHLELAEEMAQPAQRRQALFNLANVHAHQGRVDDTRRELDELLADAERVGEEWSVCNALAILGFLELSLGNDTAAADALARNLSIRAAIAAGDPVRAEADYVHALIELGRLDDAEPVLTGLEERAAHVDRSPIRALAAAQRARLEAARGDLDAAVAALEEAFGQHARSSVPFDLARTLVTEGQIRRRRGERRAAREALERAVASFDELGAPLWSERAAAELRRIPIRRGAGDELTPTEEQVAELAAAGRTNREMAQALFMSPKTVEANLTRIYRKLGISSRAELGATMAKR
jgi:ATP/maltotriose-dependent transcriptional regulator MalT